MFNIIISCQIPSKLPLLLPIVNLSRQIAQSASNYHEGFQFESMCSVWIFMVIAQQVISFIDCFLDNILKVELWWFYFLFAKFPVVLLFFFLPKSYKVALNFLYPWALKSSVLCWHAFGLLTTNWHPYSLSSIYLCTLILYIWHQFCLSKLSVVLKSLYWPG